MRPVTLPRKAYDFLVRHWILSAILLTFSAHWFLFLRVWGKDAGFLDDKGDMVGWVNWATLGLFLGSFAFALLKTAADKYNEQAKNNGHFVLERMLSGVNAVTAAKMHRFLGFIHANRGKVNVTVFREITQPKLQIDKLLENIQITLSEISGITRDDIALSIIYRFRPESAWDWLCTINTTHDMDLQTLVTKRGTAFRFLIDKNVPQLFYPDKRTAIAEKAYLPGSRDSTHSNVGSVLCQDISIGNGTKCVHAILCITTFGKQLCEDDDAAAISKIQNIVLQPFQIRLQLELSLLYMKEAMPSKCASCSAS